MSMVFPAIYHYIKGSNVDVSSISFVVMGSTILLYFMWYICRMHIPYRVDRISESTKKDSLGTKGCILGSVMGVFPRPFLMNRVPSTSCSILGYNVSALTVMCILGGCSIIGRRSRERMERVTCQTGIFFLMISIFLILWSMVTTNVILKRLVAILVYSGYLFTLTGKGKYLENISSAETRTVEKKIFPMSTLIDGILLDESKSRYTFLLYMVSPIVSGASFYYTFLYTYSFWVLLLIVSLLAIGLVVDMSVEKSGIIKEAHRLVLSVLWTRILSQQIFYLLSGILPNTSKMHYFVDLSLETLRDTLPILGVGLSMVVQKRFKLCFLLSLTGTIGILVLGTARLVSESYKLEATLIASIYAIVFIITSTMLIFINNEIRAGMLEVEVGIGLITLYALYYIFTYYIKYLVQQ
ncbi:hypothetical protein NEOKW01_1000 [Nematocida sp. AWRm80]|nr:hypothetical protein NEOKW01_1000 [Nematocida sp. AWRm80]